MPERLWMINVELKSISNDLNGDILGKNEKQRLRNRRNELMKQKQKIKQKEEQTRLAKRLSACKRWIQEQKFLSKLPYPLQMKICKIYMNTSPSNIARNRSKRRWGFVKHIRRPK